LLCEAVDYAAASVAGELGDARTALQMLDIAVRLYCDGLLAGDYRAGCPILVVAGADDGPPAGGSQDNALPADNSAAPAAALVEALNLDHGRSASD
jgi:hypothetical protein